MISDIDYNDFKNNLFLDLTYPLLHETLLEKADSILQNGISLKKEYNAQIDRVVSIPKSENDFKNYHYHASIWINGYFNSHTGYICNPNYILRQEHAQDLLDFQEASIWKKFSETYPEEAYNVLHNISPVKNPINTEYEK